MNGINNHRKNTPHTIRNQRLKPPHRLLLAQLQMEPLPHLPHRLIRLEPDIRDIGVDHEREQIQDQVAGFAKGGVGGEAVGFEGSVVRGGAAAHAFDHFFAEFHHWGEGFGVAAEDVAEVCVEEVAFVVGVSSDVRWISEGL